MQRTTAVVALALGALAAMLLGAAGAGAHGGDPNYRSEINSIRPATEGLSAEIVDFDADLRFRNDSGETVVVMGYEGEPYLRFDPDGTVYANERSPAAYLNSERYGRVEVPASADPKAAPEWKEVSTGGGFAWHDHRSHYMSESTPGKVTDPDVRTKIFDYSIPIEVGGERGSIDGTLFWVGPQDEATPVLPFIALGVVTLGLVALVVVVRRRRRAAAGEGAQREAW